MRLGSHQESRKLDNERFRERRVLSREKEAWAPGMTLVRVHLWKRNLPYLGTPQGFAGGAGGIEHACQRRRHRDAGTISGWGRSPGGGDGNPLQYSCLENPMDGGALWAIVHGVAKGQKQLKHTHRDTSRQNPRVEGAERTCHHSELLTREHCSL